MLNLSYICHDDHREVVRSRSAPEIKGPWTKLNSPSVFGNKVLLEHSHTHSLIYAIATFMPQLQNQVVATETIKSLKYWLSDSSQKTMVGKTMQKFQTRKKLKTKNINAYILHSVIIFHSINEYGLHERKEILQF